MQREADEIIAREERAHRLRPRLMDGLRKRPGRGGRDDLEYAQLADAYVRRLSSRSPVADLARDLNVSASAIRDGLGEARRRELLTRVGKGKAGGQLTPKAIELLKQKGT